MPADVIEGKYIILTDGFSFANRELCKATRAVGGKY